MAEIAVIPTLNHCSFELYFTTYTEETGVAKKLRDAYRLKSIAEARVTRTRRGSKLGYLQMPKPAGMTAERPKKAETYADYLYRHGVMTVDELVGLAPLSSPDTARRIRRDSHYAKSFKHGTRLYENGRWVLKNKLQCWVLTSDGERLVERYLYGAAEWGYSRGEITAEERRNTNRLLWMNEMVLAVKRTGAQGVWVDVPIWLDLQGVRTNEEKQKLWMERPTMLGGLNIGDKHVGVSLNMGRIGTIVMKAKKAFPKELDEYKPKFSAVIFVENWAYESSLWVMRKLRHERLDLVRLPYEYSLDHPDKLVHVLRGERERVFDPLLTRLADDGWIVERSPVGEPYMWKARKNGRVEYFDGTFGTPLSHLYTIVLNDTGRFGNPEAGSYVLYVATEKEAKDVSAVIKKVYKGRDDVIQPECRVMDW